MDILPYVVKSDTSAEDVAELHPDGIIITGSPWSVLDIGCPRVDPEIYNGTVPVLGICYGMQRMAADLGGSVVRLPGIEKDTTIVKPVKHSPTSLFHGFTIKGLDVWMAHSCQVKDMPPGFSRTGYSPDTWCASMERDHLYAVQFHPERDGSGAGRQVLTNFFYKICKEHPDIIEQDIPDIVDEPVEEEVENVSRIAG
jgi:GMP synthase (glutamine-hydrolysing)